MTQVDGQRAVSKRGGWTLVALVVLLTVALIALGGIGIAVAEGLRGSLLRLNEAKAIYLANAGMMDAMASYRSGAGGNWFELGCFGNGVGCDNVPDTSLTSGEVFVREGPERDFLLVDMSRQANRTPVVTPQTRIGGVFTKSTFDNLELRRVSQNKPLSIVGLEVRWTGGDTNPAEKVEKVCLNVNATSPSCFDNPDAGYGETVLLPNPFPLATNTWISNNHIWFNLNLSGRPSLTIALTFLMADTGVCSPSDPPVPPLTQLNAFRQHQVTENCKRTAIWLSTSNPQNWGLWTVRAIGEVRSVPFTMRRRLRAEFRATTSDAALAPADRIIAWREE